MNLNEIGKKLADIYNLPEGEQEEALTSLANDKDAIDTLIMAFENLKRVIMEDVVNLVSVILESTTKQWIIIQNRDYLMQTAPRCYYLAFNGRKYRVRKKNITRLLALIEKREKPWKELHNEKSS